MPLKTAVGATPVTGWSGGWEAEVYTDPAGAGVTVRVSHTSGSAGGLCASLRPGEAIRSMRIIAVPFTFVPGRRRDCHFDDTPCLSLLNHPTKVQGGAIK